MPNIELDETDLFDKAVLNMIKIHHKKRADYAGDDHPNQNFYDVAYQLGLTGGHAVESHIATKQARLRVLLPRFWKLGKKAKPQNEGIDDTLLDRAVYSVLAITIWQEGGYVLDEDQ